jgi:uncharacterized membrane protein YraQ (UPF0718 family)
MQQSEHAVAASPVAEPTTVPESGGGQTTGIALVAAVVVVAALSRPLLARLLDDDAVAHWATIFVAITVQALPFLVLGVTVSAALAAFVAPRAMARLIPDRPVVAVPVATLAGAALPGCECGSVPIAGRLVSRGVPDAAALTFLLAAPAINPVVMVATAVAFPGQPGVVIARLVASAAAAMVVGFLWARFGRAEWLDRTRLWHSDPESSRVATFAGTALHDLLHAGGFLIIGAATAATLQTVVPRDVLDAVAGAGPLAVLALALLAVVMAICSEADAFVAASLTQFSPTARLTFMVVGPMVDVKLIALQAGTFGPRFAARFAPLTFVVAVAASVVVGWWLL